MTAHSAFRSHWQLNPEVDFLNHGSFGATPTVVLRAQRSLQNALERDPVAFLAPERDLEPKLDAVRHAFAALVQANPENLAFVRNATDGVNAVLRSFPFEPGDEIVVTNYGYNACLNAAKYVADRAGGSVSMVQLPFPVRDAEQIIAAVEAALTKRTRLLMIDHVASPTSVVVPIQQIVTVAHHRGIRVLIDGAHAPGMIPVDLSALDADYYTANHHKWLCAPKSSGFLYVRPELQSEVRPTVISHAANRPRPGRSRFVAEFDWTGTFDPTALLATPIALQFLTALRPNGLDDVMETNRRLLLETRELLMERLGIASSAPPEMLGSMVTLPLPSGNREAWQELESLQKHLFTDYRIEVPMFHWPDTTQGWFRVSAHAYNDVSQYARLANALAKIL